MIATTLAGGLGNQMFMYAMVRATALRCNTDFAFNTKMGFKKDYTFKRTLALSLFPEIQLNISKISTFDYYGGRLIQSISNRIGYNLLCPKIRILVEEEPQHFQEELLHLSGTDYFLKGYWQCESYFKDIRDILQKEFCIDENLKSSCEQEMSTIKDCENRSVMVGIRLFEECNSPHEKLTEDYFIKAMEIISGKISNPIFFVFTQNKEWAINHLPSSFDIRIITPKNGNKGAIQDLYLMTQCKHHIISNSSFNWWGAWLAEDCNQIVISPTNFESKDSPCKKWIKL